MDMFVVMSSEEDGYAVPSTISKIFMELKSTQELLVVCVVCT